VIRSSLAELGPTVARAAVPVESAVAVPATTLLKYNMNKVDTKL